MSIGKRLNRFLILMLLGAFGFGCTTTPGEIVYDDVLTFPLPYDLTYLRTLEAVEALRDWDLNWTNKENGIIYVKNFRYSSLNDAERREATLLVKRAGPRETSVQLAPESQRIIGGNHILAEIRQHLNAEVARRGG